MRDGQIERAILNSGAFFACGPIANPPCEKSVLSEILEVTPHLRRYYLSRKAKDGILRRAARRGRKLPPLLELALRSE